MNADGSIDVLDVVNTVNFILGLSNPSAQEACAADVNSDGNMLVVYRQYAGENTTHGQLGAGYGVVTDGDV